MKDKYCQEVFKVVTENNQSLLECFENKLSLEIQSSKWSKAFNSVHQYFRKIRISDNRKKKGGNTSKDLMKKRMKLKKETKSVKIDEEIKQK